MALHDGRGLLPQAEVMVTWVFTDVADSTRLWEWDPLVMDRSIDLHNQSIRALVDEFGGHVHATPCVFHLTETIPISSKPRGLPQPISAARLLRGDCFSS